MVMLNLCWLCDYPIDVDEAVEGHVEAHLDCLLDLNNWFEFKARQTARRDRLIGQVQHLDLDMAQRKAELIATL